MDDLRLIWIDLEMTGLLVETDVIIEVACVITGGDLQPIAEYAQVGWQPAEARAAVSTAACSMGSAAWTGLLS